MNRSTAATRRFCLDGKVAVVTGGAGLLGAHHCSILAEAGAAAISLDTVASPYEHLITDITDKSSLETSIEQILDRHGRIDILINNAARNPKVEDGNSRWSRFEHFDRETWDADIAVGLTGAFLAAQAIGSRMAAAGGGVILNVCSDLAVIAPDQRLYRLEGLAEDCQPVKPVSYSVVKHGLLGLTRYLATYWADRNVRVNAISPGGVENGQDPEFLLRVSERIPLGRMARPDEYEGAVLFLCSDASSYMNGHNLVLDGGRSVW